MRTIKFSLLIAAAVAIAWFLYDQEIPLKDTISQYVENGEILTLEAKFTPEQIMEANRRELLADNQRSYKDPSLKYYPYLLMDVKYVQPDKKTREGILLWGMVDGEMVLNADTWDRTHGFEDAITAGATPNDFKIINALAKNRGFMTREDLQRELKLEADVLDPWIDSARLKHLIVQKGNDLQLHFENPRMALVPQTKFQQWIVSKPYKYEQRVGARYSRSQIEKAAKAAFGNDFKIRTAKEVYLPVYSIEVQNPDGSVMKSFWNAVTGERITPNLLAHIL